MAHAKVVKAGKSGASRDDFAGDASMDDSNEHASMDDFNEHDTVQAETSIDPHRTSSSHHDLPALVLDPNMDKVNEHDTPRAEKSIDHQELENTDDGTMSRSAHGIDPTKACMPRSWRSGGRRARAAIAAAQSFREVQAGASHGGSEEEVC